MTDLAEAARATRRYSWRYIRKSYWACEDGADEPHTGPFKTVTEAKAACDRLNLLAALEALREPSEGMVAAGVHRARRDQIPAHVLATNWRAMIDAAIAEVRPETMNTMSGRSVGSHLCGVEGSIPRPDAPLHEERQMNKDGPVMPRVPSDDLLRRYTSHKINPVEARAIYSCIRDYLSFREKVEQAQNTSSSQGGRYDQAEDALYLTKVVRSGGGEEIR